MPGASARTHGLVYKGKGVHEQLVTTGQAKSPAFPARWLYDLLRALSGDRAFLSPSLAQCFRHCRQLRASVEALRPHGFVVRALAHSSAAPRASIASRAQRQ